MAKDGRRLTAREIRSRRHLNGDHPTWCELKYRHPNDHDPHFSAHQRVTVDFPSDLTIEAYLLKTQQRTTRRPKAALAALEFHYPGEESAEFLMTFGQLRRLQEALARLVKLGERL